MEFNSILFTPPPFQELEKKIFSKNIVYVPIIKIKKKTDNNKKSKFNIFNKNNKYNTYSQDKKINKQEIKSINLNFIFKKKVEINTNFKLNVPRTNLTNDSINSKNNTKEISDYNSLKYLAKKKNSLKDNGFCYQKNFGFFKFKSNKPYLKKIFENYKNFNKFEKIPCLLFSIDDLNYIKTYKDNKDILIYFHAKNEDIFKSVNIAKSLLNKLKINILLVEYPGYSIYNYEEKNSNKLLLNTIRIYDFLKFNKIEKIYLFGRSIGTGPATFLAKKRRVDGLILLSPFMSIQNFIESYIKLGYFIKYLLKETFNNIEYIKKIKCPLLLIHGEKDTLIPIQHSEKLFEIYKKYNTNFSYFIRFPDMNHNPKHLNKEIVDPIFTFLYKLNMKK